MTFVIADFRKSFPEFTDNERYPDAVINVWANLAVAMVNCRLWKSQTTLGQYLYVAHEITLEGQSQAAAKVGGVPGGQTGILNSKAVGSVNAAYDTQSAAEKDAGYWNLTTYGKTFMRLARIFGAGCVQL